MHVRLFLLVSLFVSGSIVALGGFEATVAAAASKCDPGLQENPGCCDRDPENGDLCCTEPRETQYVYEDGTYTCFDCTPQPTAPECCPEHTTWWEFKDGSYDCLPYFVVMPMPDDIEARPGADTSNACQNGEWESELVAWVTTEGATHRPRCVSETVTAGSAQIDVNYDTRYGQYWVTITLPAGAPGTQTNAATTDYTVVGWTGIGSDCEDCPPPLVLTADCFAYYDGTCFETTMAQAASSNGLQSLP